VLSHPTLQENRIMTDYRFVEAHKASVGALFALASEAFAGVEQLAALNLQAIKTTLVEFDVALRRPSRRRARQICSSCNPPRCRWLLRRRPTTVAR